MLSIGGFSDVAIIFIHSFPSKQREKKFSTTNKHAKTNANIVVGKSCTISFDENDVLQDPLIFYFVAVVVFPLTWCGSKRCIVYR